jgi:TRAP-type C4-dicarboxylate transport system permease small subunit
VPDGRDPDRSQRRGSAGRPRRNWFGGFTIFLNVVGTVWIIVLTVMINVDVFALWLANSPVPGVKETVGLSIVSIVFLQLANTLREGRHVSSDVFIRRVIAGRPRSTAGLFALFNLLGAALMGIILYFAIPIVTEAWQEDFTEGTPGIFLVRTWPFLAVAAVGILATTAQYLILFWRDVRILLGVRAATPGGSGYRG